MAHCYTPRERLCPTHRNAGLGSPASTCIHLSDLIQDLESQTSRMGVTWALVGRSDWQTSNLFLPQKHSLWVNPRRKEAGRLPLPQNCKIETFQNHPSPGPLPSPGPQPPVPQATSSPLCIPNTAAGEPSPGDSLFSASPVTYCLPSKPLPGSSAGRKSAVGARLMKDLDQKDPALPVG